MRKKDQHVFIVSKERKEKKRNTCPLVVYRFTFHICPLKLAWSTAIFASEVATASLCPEPGAPAASRDHLVVILRLFVMKARQSSPVMSQSPYLDPVPVMVD